MVHSSHSASLDPGRQNLGYFWAREDGSARAGTWLNRTHLGAAFRPRWRQYFLVGLQKLTGDGRMDAGQRHQRGHLGTNDSTTTATTNAREKAWQLRHDYNFVAPASSGLA